MNTKRRTAFNLSVSTIQQFKIKMAEMDMVNKSKLVEGLIEKWIADNTEREWKQKI